MLNATIKSIMLSVVMLSVTILSVVAPSKLPHFGSSLPETCNWRYGIAVRYKLQL
jgi:hypothetical protein